MKLTIGAVSVYRAGEPIVWARGLIGQERADALQARRTTW